jgi:AcrR family transcriptional regulator
VRRAAMLDEAICMLGEHGFNGLTVQGLAERCAISNAGLLYYFAAKDELLLAVLDEFELRERE